MGLTAVQLRVLGELSRSESKGVEEINQKDLEKTLAVTHPTMTEIIKRLEKKNAVICTQSRLDKRYKKINCTDDVVKMWSNQENRVRKQVKNPCGAMIYIYAQLGNKSPRCRAVAL